MNLRDGVVIEDGKGEWTRMELRDEDIVLIYN
jgi:hypothetical protein